MEEKIIEAANELIEKFENVPTLTDVGGMDIQIATECAIIAQQMVVDKLTAIRMAYNSEKETLNYYFIDGHLADEQLVLLDLKSRI